MALAQLVEYSSGMQEALGLISSTTETGYCGTQLDSEHLVVEGRRIRSSSSSSDYIGNLRPTSATGELVSKQRNKILKKGNGGNMCWNITSVKASQIITKPCDWATKLRSMQGSTVSGTMEND